MKEASVIRRHGLSVGMERVDQQLFLTLSIVGKLTHEDYKTITPMLDGALKGITSPRVRALCDCRHLEGWELRAAWDDLKLGLKHGSEFEKIAVVADSRWVEWSTKVGSWFLKGEVRHFDNVTAASQWLKD